MSWPTWLEDIHERDERREATMTLGKAARHAIRGGATPEQAMAHFSMEGNVSLNEQRVLQQSEVIRLNKELKLTRGGVDYTPASEDSYERDTVSNDRIGFDIYNSAGNRCGRWGGTYLEFRAYCMYVRYNNITMSPYEPVEGDDRLQKYALFDGDVPLGVWYGSPGEARALVLRTGFHVEVKEEMGG